MRIAIGHVETPDELLEVAFARGRKAAGRMRGTLHNKKLTRMQKSRMLEATKVSTMGDTINSKLESIRENMPRIQELAPFYQELARCTINPDYYKKSLGAVVWAQGKVKRLTVMQRARIKKASMPEQVERARTELYGRIASVLKQIKKELNYLEQCRKAFREFPAIKTDLSTVVIAGYPNVGKSTILKELTGASPKVASYPFTTQQLMFGYANEMQFIDTPGLLDRPFAKRNPIEKQAILALTHLADAMMFVIDPTEACGYGLPVQLTLLKQVRAAFKGKILLVFTKIDLATKEQIADAQKQFGKSIKVNIKDKDSIKELLNEIGRFVHAARTSA